MNTWTKLQTGHWGARIVDGAADIAPDSYVTLTRRNGSESTVVVDRIVWRGEDRATGAPLVLASVLVPVPVATPTVDAATVDTTPTLARPTGRARFRGRQRPTTTTTRDDNDADVIDVIDVEIGAGVRFAGSKAPTW